MRVRVSPRVLICCSGSNGTAPDCYSGIHVCGLQVRILSTTLQVNGVMVTHLSPKQKTWVRFLLDLLMTCWLKWYSIGLENRHPEMVSGFESLARRSDIFQWQKICLICRKRRFDIVTLGSKPEDYDIKNMSRSQETSSSDLASREPFVVNQAPYGSLDPCALDSFCPNMFLQLNRKEHLATNQGLLHVRVVSGTLIFPQRKWITQCTSNAHIVGSSPVGNTYGFVAKMEKAPGCNPGIERSSRSEVSCSAAYVHWAF